MAHIVKLGSVLLVAVALIGCDRKATNKVTEKTSGPGGTTTTTVTKDVESSGNNPPPNSQGESVPPKNP